MKNLNFYEKGYYQPGNSNDEILSELFTYQDIKMQNAGHSCNLKFTGRRIA